MDEKNQRVVDQLSETYELLKKAEGINSAISEKEAQPWRIRASIGKVPENEHRHSAAVRTSCRNARKKKNRMIARSLYLCLFVILVASFLYLNHKADGQLFSAISSEEYMANLSHDLSKLAAEEPGLSLVCLVGSIFGCLFGFFHISSVLRKKEGAEETEGKLKKWSRKSVIYYSAFSASGWICLFTIIYKSPEHLIIHGICGAAVVLVAIILTKILIKDLDWISAEDQPRLAEAEAKDLEELEENLKLYKEKQRDANVKIEPINAEIEKLKKQQESLLDQARRVAPVGYEFVTPPCIAFLRYELSSGISESLSQALQRYIQREEARERRNQEAREQVVASIQNRIDDMFFKKEVLNLEKKRLEEVEEIRRKLDE